LEAKAAYYEGVAYTLYAEVFLRSEGPVPNPEIFERASTHFKECNRIL